MDGAKVKRRGGRDWRLLPAAVLLLGLAAIGCQNPLSKGLAGEQADPSSGEKVLFPVPVALSSPPPAGFDPEEVDSFPGVFLGPFASLELDLKGRPHVSYYDESVGDLLYARRIGGTWVIETVDSTGDVGEDPSLALDLFGRPHISYLDTTNFDLKYARWNGSGWVIETVDSEGVVGRDSSLALDRSGIPHISYQDSTNDSLEYASRTGGGTTPWTIETVDEGVPFLGSFSSLALDANNRPHIGYYDAINTNVKYAFKTGADWTIEIVDGDNPSAFVGESTSLALDVFGRPGISYWDEGNQDLKYARRTGGTPLWQIQTVDGEDPDENVGRLTSLALDTKGLAHISYYDSGNSSAPSVRYAQQIGSLTWVIRTVEDGTGPLNFGGETSLALDLFGRPYISYYVNDGSTTNLVDVLKFADPVYGRQ